METRTQKSYSKRRTSTVERVFCGWSRPLLDHAAAWLLQHERASRASDQPLFDGIGGIDGIESVESVGIEGSDGALDLSGIDVVLPSSRAAERLREKLVAITSAANQAYVPPRFYLVGRLPSLLYRCPAQWATDFEQTLAWASVLARSEAARLETLVPTPPDADATAGWLDLAATTRRLQSSLAAENLTFEQVRQRAEGTAERKRWEFLVEAQAKYFAELETAERCDPNLAAMAAIAEKRCRALRPIVLVGTTVLSELVKAMLRGVNIQVTSLVAAPDEAADRFDGFGCLITDAWKDHLLPLRDEQLISAESVDDQSQAVTETIADYGTTHSIDQITIGVTDESQVAPIENRCRLLGVPTYRHLGYTVAQTAIGRLMDLIVAYQTRRSWRSLAALVRHADVHQMIGRELAKFDTDAKPNSDWLTRLDQLLSEAFPQSVDADLPKERLETQSAARVLTLVGTWLAPLTQKRQRIGKWSRALAEVLQSLYAEDSNLSHDAGTTRTRLALTATCELLQQYENLSTKLDTPVDSLTALEMLATRIAVVP